MASLLGDFLRGAPPNASMHQIDFMHTTPPIPALKDCFAIVIDDFMTEAECKELLKLAEENTKLQTADASTSSSTTAAASSPPPIWQRAMINAGGGRQVMSIDSRKSGRLIFDSREVAQRLQDRLMPFLRAHQLDRITNQPLVTGLGPAKRGEVMRLSRLNERLRFLRYEGGDYFRTHWDGCYVTPDGTEKSLYTIHLYLNGDGEQDMAELLSEIERADKRDGLFVEDGEVDLAQVGAEDESEASLFRDSALESLDNNAPLLGGATSFTDKLSTANAVRVFPQTGRVLIFQQRNVLHSGDDVFRGVKYTMRTDMLYTTEPPE
ncbi:Prolyl 4-hydroxylase alpha subunit [Penicillium alfredii]|uniref:Prolyl 4-hydroxylase alpha subunit n=1 Tax=Penicillium alfredii TaxID=1506179 RepID=A0A9W9K7S9_9EURO|nr:Prolyl 4-hydroxylase alpha subunit [Penicillium alfredii]KAJ5096208.1 Prolyl 4-hydroxylase alpha subunit [Penicillium alfredii]